VSAIASPRYESDCPCSQRNGIIDDPYFEMNWLNASLWTSATWRYETVFDMTSQQHADDVVSGTGADTLLVFDGIKMGAAIYFNGIQIGQSTD